MNGERFVWNLVYLLVALVVIIVILRALGVLV